MTNQIDFDFHVCGQKEAGVRIEERDAVITHTVTVDGVPAQGAPYKTEKREGKREVIVGHAAVFFNEDDPGTEFQFGRFFRERISRGAFDGAMKRPDDVRALRDHEPSLLLGRSTNGTLKLSVDERGLAFEVEPDSTTVGSDTRKMIRRGDLTGASFGFVVENETFEDDGDEVIRTVEAVNPLVDVGPVTFPAFTSTDTSIGRRKQQFFSDRLVNFIAEHRDEDLGRRLETRAAKFGIVIPKERNPETIARTVAESRQRRLRMMEMELGR